MNVILFGASGMVGQGILRECLLEPDIKNVLLVGRNSAGHQHEKIQEIIHKDFSDFSLIEPQLKNFDACFYCIGVSALGMTENDYLRVNYEFPMSIAHSLAKINPQMRFVYVSAMGADGSEKGKIMWARVRGKTENALLRLPFKSAVIIRPGLIQPLHGIKSKTRVYRLIYSAMGPLLPFLMALFPNQITTTEIIGRAMIKLAKHGSFKSILETKDINSL